MILFHDTLISMMMGVRPGGRFHIIDSGSTEPEGVQNYEFGDRNV